MNTSDGRTSSVTSGLLGVELGRSVVRIALLDSDGDQVVDAVERPIAKAGGPRDPIEEGPSTHAALQEGLDRLGVAPGPEIEVAVTIGFRNSGVGSGPALEGWLTSLSEEIDEAIVSTGGAGVSYCPTSCLEFAREVVGPTGLSISSVMLAPVAASRALGDVHSVSMKLGSGVAWSARILNNDVLEAFETIEGALDEPTQLIVNGAGRRIETIEGVKIDEVMCRNRGVTGPALAPAVGAALSLLLADESNLLNGTYVGTNETGYEIDLRGGPFADAAAGESSGVNGAHATVAASAPQVAAEMAEAAVDFEVPAQGDYQANDRYDETYKLRKLPRTVARSRELPEQGQFQAQPYAPGVNGPARSGPGPDPGPDPSFGAHSDFADGRASGSGVVDHDEGFQVSDFLLGALGMLAIVLLIALLL